MVNRIINDVGNFEIHVARLKEIAPPYPKIDYLESDLQISYTTMVEFVYNGVRFNRHHVEIAYKSKFYSEKEWGDLKQLTIERLKDMAEKCIAKGVPCLLDDVIGVKEK